MTNNLHAEEEKDENVAEPKPYGYFEQQVVRRIHHYYFSQLIDEPHSYIEMIHQIQTAGPDSIIWIHLNTGGGVLDTGIQLINAMQSSEAHIVASVEGYVASLGTMIFLAADEFVVHDNCIMMFHNYTGGVFGKGHEQIAALEATTKWTESLLRRLYYPFMSEDEITRLLKGEDLYFDSDDIRKRITNMVKVLEKEKKEAEAAAEAKPKRRTRKKTT